MPRLVPPTPNFFELVPGPVRSSILRVAAGVLIGFVSATAVSSTTTAVSPKALSLLVVSARVAESSAAVSDACSDRTSPSLQPIKEARTRASTRIAVTSRNAHAVRVFEMLAPAHPGAKWTFVHSERHARGTVSGLVSAADHDGQ